MLPETHLFPDIYNHPTTAIEGSTEWQRTVSDRVAASKWLAELPLQTNELNEVVDRNKSGTWRTLFADILQTSACRISNTASARVVEQTPGHYEYVQQILDWFPEARIVFVLRDARAVVASNMQAPWSPPYAWFHARRIRRYCQVLSRYENDPRTAKIRYEDFVSNSTDALRSLEPALGPGQAGSPHTLKPDTDPWVKAHYARASAPIDSESLHKWKKVLNERQVHSVLQLAGQSMRTMGYEVELHRRATLDHMANALSFPYERLCLSIIAAHSSQKKGLKSTLLVTAGAALDQLQYRWAKVKQLTRKTPNTKQLIDLIYDGPKRSSFQMEGGQNNGIAKQIAEHAKNCKRATLSTNGIKSFLKAKAITRSYNLKLHLVANSRHASQKASLQVIAK